MKNVLILGAGGVGWVAAHKCAQHTDILGDICIASRTQEKCEQIIQSIHRKENLKDKNKKIYSRKIDAMNISNMVELIKEIKAEIVMNMLPGFCNMPVLSACLQTNAFYIDIAVNENPNDINQAYPWYANFEWTQKDAFQNRGLTAILSSGFDPGVVNAYCSYALKHEFDRIDSIDIMDVNDGVHEEFFATNFDPEINLREILEVAGYWEDRQWKELPHHSKSQAFDFPLIGEQKVYLMGHEEIHSLSINMDVNTIRFWMGFSDQYLNCFTVLERLGLLNHKPVKTAEGLEVVPLKVVKACLPDPTSLAVKYTGKTCIGNLIKGEKDGKTKEIFIYNICDHAECYNELESQAVLYTAGVPPVASAILIANGQWDVKKMVNIEELNPDPFIDLLDKMGLPTQIKYIT